MNLEDEVVAINGALGTLQKGNGDLQNSFYLDRNSLLIYCHDERAKISRLIELNRDYRSALLRAAGLNEVLIKARVLFLWRNDYLVVKDSGEARSQVFHSDPTTARSNDSQIAVSSNLKGMADLMENKPLKLRGGDNPLELKLNEHNFPSDFTVAPDVLKDIKKVADLRNKSVHFCLYIPASLAQKAYEVVEKNLEHLETCQSHAAGRSAVKCETEEAKWADLCEVCGIDFLPPVKEKP